MRIRIIYDENTIQYRIQKGKTGLLSIHRSVMQQVGKSYRERAREISPKKTGYFASRWFYRTYESGGGALVELELRNDDPKAKYVLNPTKAHIIRPRNRKALRFSYGGDSGDIFSKTVEHPGTKGIDVFSMVSSDAGLAAETESIVEGALRRFVDTI